MSEPLGSVAAETDAAIEAASHLIDMDRGAVAALRYVARIIDGFADRPEEAVRDNVTIPTYLKYADALGLTPAGRLKLAKPKESGGSKLAQLRSIQGDRAS